MALSASAGAIIFTSLFLLVPNFVVRAAILVGVGTFIVVLSLNPKRRYFRAFLTVLCGWTGAVALGPILRLQVLATLLEGSSYEAPHPIFHIVAGALMTLLLALDHCERHHEKHSDPCAGEQH